ncbi:pitrilysin family protein [uncultured Agathobaculum sp.]|uniref:M16 family metallopeptidase n=1 Tax=uncultured Agathobaculum sp. TaxID=2048140 RepID=UPI0026365C88|nr:pitrilysin family protein [uncultured Agathobaculum sp.]
MYVKRVLPNGVRLISEKLDTVRTASIGIWVGNGSRYEPAALNGISHFIEHMIFKGTEKRSAQHIAIAIDALGGQANAFTDKECTCYYMKVLDKRLKTGISILADMFMHSRFAQEDIDLERGVVLEEIDMYEDSPEDVAIDKLFEKCYEGSALGRPILGTAETLQTINSEAIHDYMNRYYRPKDTVIAVSGHFTEDDLDYIADLFSHMEGEGRNQITPATYQPSLLLREKDIEQNHLCLSFPGVSLLSEERFAMNLLSSILGGGMSSRLFQGVREQNGLCYSIYTFTTPHLDTGLFSIYTGLGAETEHKALELIVRELHRFCEDGPTADELSRCREQVKTTLLMGLESTGTRMMTIGRSELLRGQVAAVEQVLAAYDKVTADDLLQLARRVFDFEQVSLAVVGQPDRAETYCALLQ